MLLQLEKVIDTSQLQVINQALEQAEFVDGKLSAGKAAQQVKRNTELSTSTEMAQHLAKIIMGNLYNHADFRNAALPHRVATPIVARYTEGMTYGDHIDDPVMGQEGQRFRCDIALTLFLNDPKEYAGGELVVHTSFGEQQIKLAAGDAVLYPASSVHRVAPVTVGQRRVAVTWIQSLIRDPAQREILYNINQTREQLLEHDPEAEQTKRLDNAYTNLIRMWAEV